MLYRVELHSIYGDSANFLIRATSESEALGIASEYVKKKLSQWYLDEYSRVKEVRLPECAGIVEMELDIHDDPGACMSDSAKGWL